MVERVGATDLVGRLADHDRHLAFEVELIRDGGPQHRLAVADKPRGEAREHRRIVRLLHLRFRGMVMVVEAHAQDLRRTGQGRQQDGWAVDQLGIGRLVAQRRERAWSLRQDVVQADRSEQADAVTVAPGEHRSIVMHEGQETHVDAPWLGYASTARRRPKHGRPATQGRTAASPGPIRRLPGIASAPLPNPPSSARRSRR